MTQPYIYLHLADDDDDDDDGHRGTCLRPLHIFALLLLYDDLHLPIQARTLVFSAITLF